MYYFFGKKIDFLFVNIIGADWKTTDWRYTKSGAPASHTKDFILLFRHFVAHRGLLLYFPCTQNEK